MLWKKFWYVVIRIPFLIAATVLWLLQVKYLGVHMAGWGQVIAWPLNVITGWWLLATVFTRWWKDEFWKTDGIDTIFHIPTYALPGVLYLIKEGILDLVDRIPTD